MKQEYKTDAVGLIAGAAILLAISGCAEPADRAGPEAEMRYRGNYTRAHEVNAFCLALSSRCYWLAPGTSQDIRETLAELAEPLAGDPYTGGCVVVAGEIDTESPRDGFAADYDGLIHVGKVYGACEDVALVTQGDISHHRWVAATPDRFPASLTPELDFGQRIGKGVFISGNDGCHEFTAVVLLKDTVAVFSELEAGPSHCLKTTEQPVFDPGDDVSLSLLASKRLQLTTSTAVVEFDLRDWVQ